MVAADPGSCRDSSRAGQLWGTFRAIVSWHLLCLRAEDTRCGVPLIQCSAPPFEDSPVIMATYRLHFVSWRARINTLEHKKSPLNPSLLSRVSSPHNTAKW